MLAKHVMSTSVKTANPNDRIVKIANIMKEESIGFLPVIEHDRLVGVVTDRDIALRGSGYPKKKYVRDIMSENVYYCFEDQGVKEIVTLMGRFNVRRVPVLTSKKFLSGVISLSDITQSKEAWRESQDLFLKYKLAI